MADSDHDYEDPIAEVGDEDEAFHGGEDEDEPRWHPKTTTEMIKDRTLRPKSNDPTWKYALLLNRSDQTKVRCLFCWWISTGGIGRMKGHLIGGDPNCGKCHFVTKKITNEIREFILQKRMKKAKGICEFEQEEGNVDPDVIIVSDNVSTAKKSKIGKKRIAFPVSTSSGKMKDGSSSSGSFNLGPLSLKPGETLEDVVRNRKAEKQPLIVDALKKGDRSLVDKTVAKAFYSAGIPFNVRNNFDMQVNYISIKRLRSEFKFKFLNLNS